MNESYYNSDFKQLRNQLHQYSPFAILNYCILELHKTWSGITEKNISSLPWYLFNIIIWGIHFGDLASSKLLDKKSFLKIYRMVNDLPDPNINLLEGIKETDLWWEIRKIFHSQKLYQKKGELIGIGLILGFIDEINDKRVKSLLDFLIILNILFSFKNIPSYFNKEYFLPLIKDDDLEFIWNFYSINIEKLHQLANRSKSDYKTVYFEKNSFTVFRRHPIYIDQAGNITAFQLPVFNYYLRYSFIEVLIENNLIEKKLFEEKFENFIFEYIKSYNENFIKTQVGADFILIGKRGNTFVEVKSGRLHALLPQFPTSEVHIESLNSTVIKGYKQVLKSFRDYPNKNNVGFIITFEDLTFGLPQDNWELYGKNIFENEKLIDEEIEFLKNYVWIIDYVEFIETIHNIYGFNNIYTFMTEINSKIANSNKRHSLQDYAKKPRAVAEIHIIGPLLNNYYNNFRDIYEKTCEKK